MFTRRSRELWNPKRNPLKGWAKGFTRVYAHWVCGLDAEESFGRRNEALMNIDSPLGFVLTEVDALASLTLLDDETKRGELKKNKKKMKSDRKISEIGLEKYKQLSRIEFV